MSRIEVTLKAAFDLGPEYEPKGQGTHQVSVLMPSDPDVMKMIRGRIVNALMNGRELPLEIEHFRIKHREVPDEVGC